MSRFKHVLEVKDVLADAFSGNDFSKERAARYRVAATAVVEGLDRILDMEYAAIDGNTSEQLDEAFVGKLDGLREEFSVFTTVDELNDAVIGTFDEMMRELYYIGDTAIDSSENRSQVLKFIFVS